MTTVTVLSPENIRNEYNNQNVTKS